MTATLRIAPDQAGYSTQDFANVISTQLDGGAPRQRLDTIGGWATINVQWSTDSQGFRYLRGFYKQAAYGGEGATLFICPLYLDQDVLQLLNCKFVPGSMKLTSQSGQRFVVSAQLSVEPIDQTTADATFVAAYTASHPIPS
jgi:hypothetical protein